MSYADPFSFVIGKLWDAIEANTNFKTLVSAANRIKIDAGFKPFKSTLTEASVPEVTILPAGKRLFEENPCNGATITQVVHITVSSGLRNTSRIFPTEWRIIQAIYTAINDNTDCILDEKWESYKIIKQITPLPIEEGMTYDDLNKELIGWACILPLEIKLFLPSSLLGLS